MITVNQTLRWCNTVCIILYRAIKPKIISIMILVQECIFHLHIFLFLITEKVAEKGEK